MTWNEIILYAIQTLLRLIVVSLIPYVFSVLKEKWNNDEAHKYLDMTEQLIKDAVDQVQQTYVENMKAEKLFDSNAQKEAFQMVKVSVLNMMNERTQEIVFEAVGDFDEYLRNKIEARVYQLHAGKTENVTAEADA